MNWFWYIALCISLIGVTGCGPRSPETQNSLYIRPCNTSPDKVAKRVEAPSGFIRRVCLDPGHGGRDGGAAVRHLSQQEKTLTLEVVRRTERILKARGMGVVVTRSLDTYVPLRLRVDIANKSGCDAFVSVHFNSAPCAKAGGIEVFYFNNPKDSARTVLSKQLGSCILVGLKEAVGTSSRGVKHGNLCVIRETRIPAVIVEPAFLTNLTEAKLLSSSHFLQQIAKGIANGIEKYYGKEWALQGDVKKHPRRESNARPVA
jgi:N-acetylmuramoyl-L-alanine amidase